jgi:hypothetical protein
MISLFKYLVKQLNHIFSFDNNNNNNNNKTIIANLSLHLYLTLKLVKLNQMSLLVL